jgi:hypothetical protein
MASIHSSTNDAATIETTNPPLCARCVELLERIIKIWQPYNIYSETMRFSSGDLMESCHICDLLRASYVTNTLATKQPPGDLEADAVTLGLFTLWVKRK